MHVLDEIRDGVDNCMFTKSRCKLTTKSFKMKMFHVFFSIFTLLSFCVLFVNLNIIKTFFNPSTKILQNYILCN